MEGIRDGATFLPKPSTRTLSPDRSRRRRAAAAREIARTLERGEDELIEDLLAASTPARRGAFFARQLARVPTARSLITGEPARQENVARAIHQIRARREFHRG